MSASPAQQQRSLLERHEDILGRRAELMERMEEGRNPSSRQRREERKEERREERKEERREERKEERREERKEERRKEARCRNSCLLQELQSVEERLRGRTLTPPSLLALETRYWASVEESLPAWELFLLGKGPHPTDGGPHPARRANHSPAKDRCRPPLPRTKTKR